MITPQAMELLSFVVPKEKNEEAAAHLLKLGNVHPVDIRHIEENIQGLTIAQIEKESQVLESLEARKRDIARKLKVSFRAPFDQPIPGFSLPEIEERLNAIEKGLEPYTRQRDEIQQELALNQSMLAQARDYFPFPLERKSLYSFLEVATGRIQERNIVVLEKSLSEIPHVLYPFHRETNGRVLALVIGLRRDRALIQKVLNDVSWQEVDRSAREEFLSPEAQAKIAVQAQENKLALQKIEADIRALGQLHLQDITAIGAYLSLRKSLLEAQRFSLTTEKTVLFSGWVPAEEKEKVVRDIKNISDLAYFESKAPDELDVPKDEIPVRMRHGALVAPFELLVGAYGLPRYGTIDPTVFVAISFLVMFGAMFGDLGHGLVLVLASIFMFKKDLSEGVRRAGALVLYCGASSCVFGLLYGSFFGFEFKSLWMKPMENILEVFKISIFFGIGIITLGIGLNIANALRDKDYAKALFTKAGLIGGIVYWAAIGLVVKVFYAKAAIPLLYSRLISGGLLLLFLYPLAESLFDKRHKHPGLLESFIESIVNILEFFMGYLANTVSFIRVAAFALAHAGLFLAIFTLSRMTHAPGQAHGAASWAVIILGNVFVVCLEGLVVSIQSVRLHYYEFFSKFFVSGKNEYKPLTV